MATTIRMGIALLAIFSGVAIVAAQAAAQPRNLGLVSYRAPVVPQLLVDGSAVVAFTVRANGRVGDALTLAASDDALGDAAREAVLEWRFDRDLQLGRGREAMPNLVLRRQVIEFVFKRDGIVTSMSHLESAKTWFPPEQQSGLRLVRSDELESPLVRIPAPASEPTTKLLSSLSVAGIVIVSFVVDETGTVRVPVTERTEEPVLIEAALAVLAGWRYEPPTLGGEPVMVEERNTLTFTPRVH